MRRRLLVLLAAATAAGLSVGCSDSGENAYPSIAETIAPSQSPTASIPVLLPDEVLPPNEPHRWELRVHCGAAFFSQRINGTWWRTTEGYYPGWSWMPPEWGEINGRTSGVPVVLELNATGDQLTATYVGRAVVYTPTEPTEADLCD